MCRFSSDELGKVHEEIAGFDARVKDHIPPIVQQACVELLDLLPNVPADFLPTLLPHLTTFTTRHLLIWIEILSLTGSLTTLLHRLPLLLSCIPRDHPTTHSLTHAYRMVRYFYGPISRCASQVYRTAVPFSPLLNGVDALVKGLPVYVALGRPQTWGAVLSVWMDGADGHGSVGFGDGGGLVVSTWGNGEGVRVRDTVTGEMLGDVNGGDLERDGKIVRAIGAMFGRRLGVVTDSGGVYVGSVEDVSRCERVGTVKGQVDGVAFDDEGKMIAVATSENGVGRIDFFSVCNDVSFKPASHFLTDATVSSIVFQKGSSRFVFAILSTGRIQTLDSLEGFCINDIQVTPPQNVTVSSLSNTGDLSVYGTQDGTVYLWRKCHHLGPSFLAKHQSSVSSVCVSDDGRMVASSAVDGSLILYDVLSGRKVLYAHAHPTAINSIAISPNLSEIATTGRDGTIRVWGVKDLFEYFPVATSTSTNDPRTPVKHVAISANGRLVAASNEGWSGIRVWDLRKAQSSNRKLYGHLSPITCLVFSKTAGFLILASGSEDKTVRIWDPETGIEFFSCNALNNVPRGLDFSLGGTHVRIGAEGANGEKRVMDWGWKSGRHPVPLRSGKNTAYLSVSASVL
ncbi:hypothetical protein HDU67_006234 [Dinochytrium kinnereticum]|nr:hypothetical protein HDU67_006234 [Dinochytrium kinnereticum]